MLVASMPTVRRRRVAVGLTLKARRWLVLLTRVLAKAESPESLGEEDVGKPKTLIPDQPPIRRSMTRAIPPKGRLSMSVVK